MRFTLLKTLNVYVITTIKINTDLIDSSEFYFRTDEIAISKLIEISVSWWGEYLEHKLFPFIVKKKSFICLLMIKKFGSKQLTWSILDFLKKLTDKQ